MAHQEKQRARLMAGEWNDWAVPVGMNFDLREDLQQLFALERCGVDQGRARLRRA